MLVDLLFDPFDARWVDLRDGALAAEAAGFDGVWPYIDGVARVRAALDG